MNGKKAFKRAALSLLGLAGMGGMVGAAVSCGATAKVIRLVYGGNSGFGLDKQSREILADRAYKTSTANNSPTAFNYSTDAVKDVYSKYLVALGKNAFPTGDIAVNFISRIATAINDSNKDQVLAWRDPSTTALTKADEKYVVYLEGGPLGDVCHENVDAINSFDKYGRDYYVNESQYGFVPKDVVLSKGSTSKTNEYFSSVRADSEVGLIGFKDAFDTNRFTAFDYFRLIGGNASYTDEQVALLTSFVYAMVTADRTYTLLSELSSQTSNVYLFGASYGMHAGLELLLFWPGALNFVKKAELGWNRLTSGPVESVPPVDNNGDGVDDSGVVYGNDIYFDYAVTYAAYEYGYLQRLTAALGSEKGTASDFLAAVRQKVQFGFSTDDATIGPLPATEKAFYEKYSLDLDLTTGGHSAFLKNDGFKALTGSVSADYSYDGLTTRTLANQGKGCNA